MPAYAPDFSPKPPDDGTQADRATPVLKIVIAGGFGAGKTTLVGAVSEIPPLTTEEYLTSASSQTDSLTGVEGKTTTTVSMDFGRITLNSPQPMMLLLFGTPGQERFLFAWDDLADGAIGAVVLADTRRLAESFTAIDYFEQRKIPFIVAVNEFDDADRYTTDEVRDALELAPTVPILLCDARNTHSVAPVLITLVRYALSALRAHTAPLSGART